MQKIATSQLVQTRLLYRADLATERESQLTTGKRAESTKRDFRCQFAGLPLVKPVVWFARAVFNWSSLSVAKSAQILIYSDNRRALINQELSLKEGL